MQRNLIHIILLIFSCIIMSTSAYAQQPPPGMSPLVPAKNHEPNVAAHLKSIEDHSAGIGNFRNHPESATICAALEAPGGFYDYHYQTMKESLRRIRSWETVNLIDFIRFEREVQLFYIANMDITVLLGDLRIPPNEAMFSRVEARKRINSLMYKCYFGILGETAIDCAIKEPEEPAIIFAAFPHQDLPDTYGPEFKMTLELTLSNRGEKDVANAISKITVKEGYLVNVISTSGTCRRNDVDWECIIPIFNAGIEIIQKATIITRLPIGVSRTEMHQDILTVTVSSPDTKIDPETARGGYRWNITDCHYQYREAMGKLNGKYYMAFKNSRNKAIKKSTGLPSKRIYPPGTVNQGGRTGLINTLVDEVIYYQGADKYLTQEMENGALNKFFDRSLEFLTNEQVNGKCHDPKHMLRSFEKSRAPFLKRKNHINRLAFEAGETARKQTRILRATLRSVGREGDTWDAVKDETTKKTAGFVTNRLLAKIIESTGMGAAGVSIAPKVLGGIGALISVIQIMESSVDLITLADLKLQMPEILAALETAAYLEGLDRRYKEVEDAQDKFIKDVRETYEKECYCRQ